MHSRHPLFSKVRLVGVLMLLLAVVVACGDDGGGDSAEPDEAASAEPEVVAPSEREWVEHEAPEECQCAHGSEFTYWSRTADPDKVVLYYQGGGICFTPEACSLTDGSYSIEADASDVTSGAGGGIFDFENPDNPFKDWSMVFVPYCTGDVHLGTAAHEYTPDVTVNHVGFLNASAGMQHVVDEFGDASQVFVTGSSAGGAPTPLMAGLIADQLPEAEVAALADASGVIPDDPELNAALGAVWRTLGMVPDWPENEGLQQEDVSVPGLFVQTGLHNPDIRLASYNNAYDEAQQGAAPLFDLSDVDLLSIFQSNEAGIEAEGVEVDSYIAAGTRHTILGDNALYTLETEGVAFLDWLNGLIAGEELEDVVCTDCGEPAPPEEPDE